MAVQIVKFPLLNTVRFVRATNVQDYFWNDRIPSFESDVDYVQKYQTSDYIQFSVAFNPAYINSSNILCQLRDCRYNQNYGYFLPLSIAFIDGDGLVHLNMKLTLHNPLIPEGEYYIYLYMPQVAGGNFDLFYSEKISIKTEHENTIQLKYTNEGNDFDNYFYLDFFGASKTYFIFRVEGGFKSDGFKPGSMDSMFQDQNQANTLLSSVPYDVRQITFGNNKGLPNWVSSKINRIFSCTNVQVDGVEYTKTEGAKIESSFTPRYPFGIWTLDLIKSDNDYSEGHNYTRTPRPAGIGSMEIELDFIVSPNTTGDVADIINNGLVRPKPMTLGAITALVPYIAEHDIGLPYYIWQIRDNNNEVQFSTNIKDPDNPTTAIKLVSEVDIAAGLELRIVGFYEF